MESAQSANATVTGPLTGRTLDAKSGKPVDPKDTVKADKANGGADKKPASEKKAAPPSKKEAAKPDAKVAPAKDNSKKITLLVKENPHKVGTKDRAKFQTLSKLSTKTVKAALDADIDQGYINYAVKRGLIKVA